MPDAMEATRRIMPGVRWQAGHDFPSTGQPTPKRLIALASAMADYDLVLTYNFGAMDAVLAHTLFAQILKRRRWSITRTALIRTKRAA
jgi:hypothetical protein